MTLRWTPEDIPDLTPGRDKYPASQQPILRRVANRGVEGVGVRSTADGASIRPSYIVPDVFLVQVEQDGGSAGDAESNCSYTYKVMDMAGTTIATTVTPYQSRYSTTAYTAGDGLAFAAFDGEDELQLMWVPKEIAQNSDCD